MKNKITTSYSILKVNDDESISTNTQKMNATLQIFRDDDEQFFIIKERFDVSKNKINETIKKYHDKSLQSHSDIFKTMQLLRRHCRFSHMRQTIEAYIRKCLNCQRNKHNIHRKYDEIQYETLSKTL